MKIFNTVLSLVLSLFLVNTPCFAQLPFFEGFESGDFIEGEWNLSGNIQISIEDPAEGIYCAAAEGPYGINRVFDHPVDSLLTLEFKAKAGQARTTALIFRIKDGPELAAGTGLGLILRNTGELIALDGTTQIALLEYAPTIWYHFKIVIHIESRTYDVYVDDDLKASGYQFYSSTFTRPALFTWSSLETFNTFFIDDIKLYAGDGSVGVQPASLAGEKIGIYPNPAKDFIRIEGPADLRLECRITNLLGQLLLRQPVVGNGVVSLGNVPVGTYLVAVYKDGALVARRKLGVE